MRNSMLRRWYTLLLLSAILSPVVTFAQQSIALAPRASLPAMSSQQQPVRLVDLLKTWEKDYSVNFGYADQDVAEKYVTLEVNKDQTLPVQLQQILAPLKLQYQKINASFYVIHRQEASPPVVPTLLKSKPSEEAQGYDLPPTPRSVLVPYNAQKSILEKTITGQVTDLSTNETLPGVNVLVKGTTIGTVTDIEGNYRLTAPDDAKTLVFSSVGYTSEEVEIGNQTVINLELAPDIQSLSEVVVVGYGTQRKSDVTGSVARVSTEKTADLPNYSVLQSMQGQVPGVNITNPGRPGEDPNLNIRGTNSLTAGNQPLVVVDGVIYNGSISDFNPNDIATVDVLKDASATAVFGSRAANGVLLITTKIGKTDKPTFNFNTYVGVQQPAQLIDVLDGPGYQRKTDDYNQILLANNPDASPIEFTQEEQENIDAGRETDWIQESLQQSIISNYHLDVSGRNEKTDYYIAGTYFNQNGIVANDDFDRLTFNLNLTNYITDWYSISVRSAYSAKDFSGIEASLDQAYRQSPYGNLFNEDGPGGYAFLPIGDPLGENPLLNTLIENEDKRTSLRGLISSQLEVPFIPGLQWTLNYATNIRNNRYNVFFDNESTVDGQIQNGIAQKEVERFYDWTLDNIINYKQFFGQHSVDLTLLLSREYRNFEETLSEGRGLVSQSLGYNSIGLGAIQQVASNFEEQNAIAQMARLNYGYNNRYAMTFTVRRDGFSAFSDDNKYAIFPSAAFAWTVTNESFMDNTSWLDNLKVRLSYGINGNQAIDRYSSISRIGTNQYLFGNDGTSLATYGFETLGNEDLTWETTVATNLGLDFAILNSRVAGSINVYQSTTSDLLQSRSIPNLTGFSTVLTNIGEMQNQGIEVAINTNNIANANLKWQTGVAFSLNRNEIVSLGGIDNDGDGIEDDDIANGWFIGETFNAVFGYKTDGLYQLNDDIPDGFRPGDYRIVDVDGDGEITPEDRVILGTESPNFLLSLSNTLRYKRFSLYVLLNSVIGGGNENFYVGDNYETRSVNRRGFTTFSERFNVQDVPYWTPNNPTNEYPRLDYIAPFDHPILEDRSFVRIQDISLAYNIPQTALESIGLQKLRLYASAKNLFTFTSWSGYDPEQQTTVQDLPFIRSYTLGVDFSF